MDELYDNAAESAAAWAPEPAGDVPIATAAAPPRRPRLWLHGLLFGLTIVSTVVAGAMQQGVHPLHDPAGLIVGLPFSVALLAILMTHEMGHYLTSRYHGIRATLPYFLPAPPIPPLFGTFGAFIRMDSPILDRRALIDVGASGPIAGFVVAVAATAIGLHWSTITAADASSLVHLGEPLALKIVQSLVLGPVPAGQDIVIHPVGYAGWIGMFVTMLNLIPIGQLDGGHVAYAIFGERHRQISLVMVGVLIVLGYFAWPGWFMWAVLPMVFGLRHPPLLEPHTPLDPLRKAIGWTALALFVLTFIPVPFSLSP